MDKEVLKISNLDVGYNSVLVNNINCSLYKGQFVSMFGANGTGKSTFIKTILQQIPIKKGSVFIENKRLKNYTNLEISKLISIVYANNNIDLNLTAKDVLCLGRIPYLNILGRITKLDEDIINKYIELLNISDLLEKYFHQLSDGQKQKILLARALIQDTPLIILDEPTSHLDIKNRIEIFKLLKNISKKENKSIVCVTHEIDIAIKYSDIIWYIDKGKKFNSKLNSNVNLQQIYDVLF